MPTDGKSGKNKNELLKSPNKKHDPRPRTASPWAVPMKAGTRRAAKNSEHEGTWRPRKRVPVAVDQLSDAEGWRVPGLKDVLDSAHVSQAKRAWLELRRRHHPPDDSSDGGRDRDAESDLSESHDQEKKPPPQRRALFVRKVEVKDCSGENGAPVAAVRITCEETLTGNPTVSKGVVVLCSSYQGLPGTRKATAKKAAATSSPRRRGAPETQTGDRRPTVVPPSTPRGRIHDPVRPLAPATPASPSAGATGPPMDEVEGWYVGWQYWVQSCQYCKNTFEGDTYLLHTECGERPIKCPFCKKLFPSKDMDAHSETCGSRPLSCPTCGATMMAAAVDAHTASRCPGRPLQCAHCKENVRADVHVAHERACHQAPGTCKACGESMPRSALQQHMKDSCRARVIPCSRCAEPVQDWSMAEHLQDLCPATPMECPHCRTMVRRDTLRSHMDSCGEADVVCPRCDAQLKRAGLNEHDFELCPQRIVECELCGVRLPFSEKETHMSVCLSQPSACSACGRELPRGALASHVATCAMVSEECANCHAAVQREKMAWHLSSECERRPVACSLCTEIVLAGTIEEHWARACKMKPERCRFCNVIEAKCDMNLHIEECSLAPITCPVCDEDLFRYQLSAHQARSCSGRTVSCLSCGERVVAAALGHHTLTSCKAAPAPCADCGVLVRPQELEMHRSLQQCGVPARQREAGDVMANVTCDALGCGAVVAAHDLPSHKAEFHPEQYLELGLKLRRDTTTREYDVVAVLEDGAAHRAGVSVGDRVVEVNGVRLAAAPSFSQVLDETAGQDTVIAIRRQPGVLISIPLN